MPVRTMLPPLRGPVNDRDHRRNSNGLVIDHTGNDIGGVSVFVFPKSTKDQRDSFLTRLADEKAYRRLAISTDTKWADIAFRQMPVKRIGPVQDVSKAIALLEQLKRVGVGLGHRGRGPCQRLPPAARPVFPKRGPDRRRSRRGRAIRGSQ